jgi:hypothetical protein
MLLVHIRVDIVSNLLVDTDYPYRSLSWFYLNPLRKFQYSTAISLQPLPSKSIIVELDYYVMTQNCVEGK